MSAYASFDAAGFVRQMSDDGDPTPIPDEAIKLSEADFLHLVTAPHGWRWDGRQLAAHAPPVVAPPPPDITDRQFARGLWGDGIIAYPDYLGFIGPGTIPPPLQAIVDTLPDDDTGRPTPRKEAVGLLTGERSYRFSAPLVEAPRQAMAASDPKWTPDYLRDRWLAWSAL